jgi:hypothetical protein
VLRRKLGYIDERPGEARRPFIATPSRRMELTANLGLVNGDAQRMDRLRSRAPAVSTQSDRLLAAKRRAARR